MLMISKKIAGTYDVMSRLVSLRAPGNAPVAEYLRRNEELWKKLPPWITACRPMRAYGALLHKSVRIRADRKQQFGTFFLRNRPLLELIRHWAELHGEAAPFTVAVLGCSIGAEVYSIAWSIRTAQRDRALVLRAVDISADAVAAGRRGVYPVMNPPLPETNIFERMSKVERDEIFEREGPAFRIKDWVREGIEWYVADVGQASTRDTLGTHDVVVANNFLCHMEATSAEACLRSISNLVRPNGYLVASGVDLDVRAKVAGELGWKPLEEKLEEIHEGDPVMRACWPFRYYGLEPLNKRRRNWRLRYASAFQIPPPVGDADHRNQRGSHEADCMASILAR